MACRFGNWHVVARSWLFRSLLIYMMIVVLFFIKAQLHALSMYRSVHLDSFDAYSINHLESTTVDQYNSDSRIQKSSQSNG